MKMSNQQYLAYLKTKDPKSPTVKNTLLAFLVGGGICAAGQGLLALFKALDLSAERGKMAVTLTLIFLSALFTALGLYDRLAKHAGAGTLIPITGFANAVVAPAIEFKSEGYMLGMSAKMFTVAGPVLVYGVAASVVYGLIRQLVAG